MDYKIQPIGIESVEILSQVAQRAYLDHYCQIWKNDDPTWYIERCFTIETLSVELNDSQNAFYLIFKNEKPVGFLKLILKYPLSIGDISEENALYLERIYFMKEAVGQGLGDKVFDFAIQKAQDLKRKIIWLAAMDTSHKPIAFYERMGFEICGRKRLDFEVMKEEMRGMVVMMKIVE